MTSRITHKMTTNIARRNCYKMVAVYNLNPKSNSFLERERESERERERKKERERERVRAEANPCTLPLSSLSTSKPNSV